MLLIAAKIALPYVGLAVVSVAAALTLRGDQVQSPQATPVEGSEQQSQRTILYHYSMSPTWNGATFPEGGFLTDDPTMGSEEARQKLALPNVKPGQPLYLYKIEVELGDTTPGEKVEPIISNTTGEVLPGGGREYIAVRPLPMEQKIGGPVGE